MFKQIAARLPESTQQLLKRLWYYRQIRRGRFQPDEPEQRFIGSWVRPGDWVVDCGANVGHYTSLFSRHVGSEGRVIAFEPIDATFELLASNVRWMAYRNVTLVNAAVSSQCGIVSMDVPKLNSGLKNYYMASISDGDLQVLAIAIDSLSVPSRVSLIKIDVEGHEYDAIIGMKQLILRDRPVMIVEGAEERVNSLLVNLGYRARRLANSPNSVYLDSDTVDPPGMESACGAS